MLVWLLLSKPSFDVVEDETSTANSFGFGYFVLLLSLAMTVHDVYFCFMFLIKTLRCLFNLATGGYRWYAKSFSATTAPRPCCAPPTTTPVLRLVPTAQDVRMTFTDVESVMERLGIFGKREGLDAFSDGIGSKEMISIFNEEEPELDELKEAFYVFDENCDGFIDAKELREVLVKLGVSEFSEHDCRRLIKLFDEDGDGLIDFREFGRVVERSFNSE
ncbi:hypothetical protein MLD38_032784 [Melastoma candidum]|uniref:Uncharacterized protein n=1 Tax=Melastoma candidum TaxID=119954 RepID=A0ACB9M753_9MYRT|nr:hypothetical protein MLD38_032784 [Melastoma candidum]